MQERARVSEGRLTFFLLLVMLISATWSIAAARWTGGLEQLATATILALVAGLLLARSTFPSPIAHLFSLFYGLFTVGYLVGRMVPQPTWQDRLVELGERSATWLTKATSGGTSRDSLMFVLLLAGLFWFLGHIAAWYTYRRPRVWRVVLPIGLTVLVNQYVYTDPRISTRSNASLDPFLLVFLIAALLYVVRTYIFQRELGWRRDRVSYSSELRLDFLRSGLLFALVVLLVVAIAPGARAGPSFGTLWSGIEDYRNSVRETAARLFSSLDVRGHAVANPFSGRLVLGGPRDLGDTVFFDVQASQGRYWQAVIYDRYTGDDWLNSDDHKVLVPPGHEINANSWTMRQEITQTVTLYLPGSTQLFAAPEPARVLGLTTRADVSFVQGRMTPPTTLHSDKTLQPGNVYRVVSAVNQADPDTLRDADENYPDWITERYLQLPGTVTDRTRSLAAEITAGQETAFDKARAIEEYLRQNLNYSLDVPAPPEGQDFVDFVLFDLQRGYCDYYASSFVILARAAGLPTRFVGGYVQDEYDSQARAYRVRAKNGHSWPEVYFPRYGWIQFEPTVIVEPINWPAPPSDTAGSSDTAGDSAPPPASARPELEELLGEDPELPQGVAPGLEVIEPSRPISPIWIGLLGVLVVAGLGAGVAYWASELRGMGGLNLIERAYARMWRFASWLGVPSPPDQTPYERADELKQRVPDGELPITHITEMYVRERFSHDSGDNDRGRAEARWSVLRPMLWKRWLQGQVDRFRGRDESQRWRDFIKAARSAEQRTKR